jgi:hypothetical protein
MDDLRHELETLRRRVATLEAKEEVTRAMYNWGRWLDRIELTGAREDAEYLAKELMTEDGVMNFDEVGWGVWGPAKESVVVEFLKFSTRIGWAYHYYLHPEVDVDIDKGTAHFYTGAEWVPLKLDGRGQWLFLVQNSDWVKVNGKWKMKLYKLTNLRTVSNAREDW